MNHEPDETQQAARDALRHFGIPPWTGGSVSVWVRLDVAARTERKNEVKPSPSRLGGFFRR